VTQRVRYTYDALDRRIAKEIDANADGTYESIERYSYDGDNVVLVHDGSGGLKSRYLHGQGQDQVLAEETSSGAVRWALLASSSSKGWKSGCILPQYMGYISSSKGVFEPYTLVVHTSTNLE